MQLFCFPFAGGTAAFFDQLEKVCIGRVEFIKLEYPGHGTRHREKFCNNFEEIARDAYKIMQEKYDGNGYALMGYSMGSISAFSTLILIDKLGEFPLPVHIFLAAHEPHTIINLKDLSGEKLDEFVKLRTIEFGAVPDKLINNKSFWRTYLPLYKSDYLLINSYDFECIKYRSSVPATMFYSEEDTSSEGVEGWNNFFVLPCEFIKYTGPHFFIVEHYTEIGQEIMKRLGV